MGGKPAAGSERHQSEQTETPASRRMRERFLPTFLKVDQPSIPGIWGGWSAQSGVQKEAVSEWPQYRPGEVLPSSMAEAEAGRSNHGSGNNTSRGESREFEASTTKMDIDVTGESDASIAILPPSVAQSSGSSLLLANYATLDDEHGDTSVAATKIKDPVQTSPQPAADRFHDDTNMEKDHEIKKVLATTQDHNSNGPMWGVASRPPITFNEDDDFSVDLLGEARVAHGLSLKEFN